MQRYKKIEYLNIFSIYKAYLITSDRDKTCPVGYYRILRKGIGILVVGF